MTNALNVDLFMLLENDKLDMIRMRIRHKRYKFTRTKVCKTAEDVRKYFGPKIQNKDFE